MDGEEARSGREAIRGRVRGERVHVRARDDGKRW